jgi:hypothetical protein
MAAEEQEATADQEDQPEHSLATVESAVVMEPEDPGGEEPEADEGGGDDAEDGAEHLEDTEAGQHGQPDPQVLAGRLRGGDQVPALGRVLLRDHRPGDQVGQDPPTGQAAEDDGQPDERRIQIRRRGQPAGHTAQLPVLP